MRTFLTMTTAALMSLGLGNLTAEAHGCPLTDMVQSWYGRYLHRAADPGGLHTWVSALRCGSSPEEVQASILGSEEYYCAHGHSAEGFVTGLYADVLGRTACAQDIHNWVCRLRSIGCRKALTREFLCAANPELARRTVAVPVAVRPPVTHFHAARTRVVPVPVPVVVPSRVHGLPVRPVLPASGYRGDYSYRSR